MPCTADGYPELKPPPRTPVLLVENNHLDDRDARACRLLLWTVLPDVRSSVILCNQYMEVVCFPDRRSWNTEP